MTYAEIILPFALKPLTYRYDGEGLEAGMAVMVGLGQRKLCQGIVWRVLDGDPGFRTRPVERILYRRPLLTDHQMRFWEWLAGYYMCTLGEVMAAAIPASLRPEGFSAEEFSRGEFRPTTVRYVGLNPVIAAQLNEMLDRLRKAGRQYTAMMEFLEKSAGGAHPLPRRALDADGATLRKLEEKGFLYIEEIPLEAACSPVLASPLPALTAVQREAMDSIAGQAGQKRTVLLHGVAGSGKTEIFINLAARELDAGRSVLYLLPEIPISWQLVERLGVVFGERLVAYHSKFTARRRAEIFLQLAGQDAGPRIFIGTRMSVFLPLRNLGLIIVDEEHDATFKQDSPAPRFHARDCALVLASLHGARTVLGSATPSLESYYNATTGKYGLVTLAERYGEVPPPRITLSDSLRSAKRGERESHFNKPLLDKLSATLAEGAQAIVFQNRRGFSPYVECGACGWSARCPDCNVTLTLHKGQHRLRCHYCGYNVAPPHICPSCGQGELLPKGYGTEKVEEELARLFPGAAIDRLDSDTAASPRAARQIISRFEQGRTDILVGTQMVTKGFDFGGVRLVGVVNADNLLNYPDFRASERAFQLLAQAAGRAGRRDVQGEAVIQSTQPAHPVLQQVGAGNYEAMARTQLAERRSFGYPPYCRLISITLKHCDSALVAEAAAALASSLRPIFGRRVLGPQPPAVDRVMGEHILVLLLKVERDKSFAKAKEILAGHIETLRAHAAYKKVTLTVDVDPQ